MIRILAFLLLFHFAACKENIVHDLSEAQANRLTARLHLAKIQPEKTQQNDGKWSIAVPNNQVLKAIQILDRQRLIKNVGTSGKTPEGFLSSRSEQKLSYQNSISKQLEQTFLSMPGVLEAHVHLNLPSKSTLWREEKKTGAATASVLLIVDHEFSLQDPDVKEIVAGASGITAQSISLVLSQTDLPIETVSSGQVRSKNLFLLSSNSLVVAGLALSFALILIFYFSTQRKKQKFTQHFSLTGEKI